MGCLAQQEPVAVWRGAGRAGLRGSSSQSAIIGGGPADTANVTRLVKDKTLAQLGLQKVQVTLVDAQPHSWYGYTWTVSTAGATDHSSVRLMGSAALCVTASECISGRVQIVCRPVTSHDHSLQRPLQPRP